MLKRTRIRNLSCGSPEKLAGIRKNLVRKKWSLDDESELRRLIVHSLVNPFKIQSATGHWVVFTPNHTNPVVHGSPGNSASAMYTIETKPIEAGIVPPVDMKVAFPSGEKWYVEVLGDTKFRDWDRLRADRRIKSLTRIAEKDGAVPIVAVPDGADFGFRKVPSFDVVKGPK